MNQTKHLASTKWFFIAVAVIALYLFWRIVEPYIIVLITALIFAIVFSPVDRKLKKYIPYNWLRALVVVFGVLMLVVIPLFVAAILIAQQAGEIINLSLGEYGWLSTFNPSTNEVFTFLPVVIQEQVLALNFIEIGKNIAEWAFSNLGNVFSRGASFVLSVFIFFMALYYFLVARTHLYKETLALSPFRDTLDANVAQKMIHTVRSVVFGKVLVALAQAVLAAIGMTIFGVPGALLWGALIIITGQIPMIGAGIILVPAVIYLVAIGSVGNAIGLAIWALIVVGLIDNVLSPIFVGSKTQMPGLFVLIAILGGLKLFGPIGFILGPTILAGVYIMIDIYKTGILEDAE